MRISVCHPVQVRSCCCSSAPCLHFRFVFRSWLGGCLLGSLRFRMLIHRSTHHSNFVKQTFGVVGVNLLEHFSQPRLADFDPVPLFPHLQPCDYLFDRNVQTPIRADYCQSFLQLENGAVNVVGFVGFCRAFNASTNTAC